MRILVWLLDTYFAADVVGVKPIHAVRKYADVGRDLYFLALFVEFERSVPMVGQLFLHAPDVVNFCSLSGAYRRGRGRVCRINADVNKRDQQ